jgi:hypothetical protein
VGSGPGQLPRWQLTESKWSTVPLPRQHHRRLDAGEAERDGDADLGLPGMIYYMFLDPHDLLSPMVWSSTRIAHRSITGIHVLRRRTPVNDESRATEGSRKRDLAH